MTKFRLLIVLSILALIPWAACTGGNTTNVYVVYTGGNPKQGRKLVIKYRCGSCHVIPGVPNANGTVGAPLTAMGRRTMIAGVIPNTPPNMERWVRDPKAIDPKTAMPDLGLTKQQARDVAAYLYTLQ